MNDRHRIDVRAVILGALALCGCAGSTPAVQTPSSGASRDNVAEKNTDGFIPITEENFAHAETAKNFRNWAARGANEHLTHMRGIPPRGDAAPTIQMNDDTLYSVIIAEVDEQDEVTFTIPETDVYMAVQVVNEGGHGLHYVVDEGTHTVKVDSQFAFLIYRSGTEKGLDAARAAQDLIEDEGFKFGTYEVKNYDYDEVQRWVERYREETRDYVLEYTFPRSASEITDLHQWNLEVANGWGGSSPEVGVSNKYTNSKFMDGATCYQTTFENPRSVYFTSVTAYDRNRYLLEGVRNVSSYTWTMNRNGTTTVSFNCGDEAPNNIDTKGQTFSFTMRYYGVSQKVMDGEIAPTKTVKKGTAPM